MPISLSFGHGEVIDSLGNRSRQTDAVVLSRDHPGTFTPELPNLFYVEAVLAAAQVKSVLTTGELRSTLGESVAFKRLRVHNQVGTMVACRGNPAQDRYALCPPFFLFAYSSQLTLDKVRHTVADYRQDQNLDHGELVDAIFLLGRGCVVNVGDRGEALQSADPQGSGASEWVAEQTEDVLMALVHWLSTSMRQLIYQPPILTAYLAPSPEVPCSPIASVSSRRGHRR
jgi:hypothetical protein